MFISRSTDDAPIVWFSLFLLLCLQNLEAQQQLAVAINTDAKKDQMIEQLDKVSPINYNQLQSIRTLVEGNIPLINKTIIYS